MANNDIRDKVLISLPKARTGALMKMIEAFGSLIPEGEVMNVEVMEGAAEPMKARRATVQYRAIADSSALEAIGQTTVNGIIFAHLLERGPCTERDIREARSYTSKSVQSALDKLKTMGVVKSEPLGTE